MSTPRIFYKASSSDLKKSLKYDPVKDNKNGLGQSAILSRSQKIYIQTPKMYCPFGVNEYDGKYSVSVSFGTKEPNEDMITFEKFMNSLDDMIIDEIIDNKKWLECLNVSKKIKDRDTIKTVIEGFYTPLVKESTKKDMNGNPYPSMLKIKLPKYTDGNYATTLWTSKGEPTDKLTDETIFERIPKGCNIRMLFQVQKIWFSGKTKCGCIINAIQMKVYKPKNNTNKCLMENDSD
jgi:hypothetical protein